MREKDSAFYFTFLKLRERKGCVSAGWYELSVQEKFERDVEWVRDCTVLVVVRVWAEPDEQDSIFPSFFFFLFNMGCLVSGKWICMVKMMNESPFLSIISESTPPKMVLLLLLLLLQFQNTPTVSTYCFYALLSTVFTF